MKNYKIVLTHSQQIIEDDVVLNDCPRSGEYVLSPPHRYLVTKVVHQNNQNFTVLVCEID